MEESMQSEPHSTQEDQKPEQAPVQEMKPQKRSPITGILAIFLVILLVAVAGLGFWAYQLNTSLMAAQQQLTALQDEHAKLQSDHAKLKSDHEKLTTDFSQAKADLEKSNGDLTTAQADLKKSQDQNEGLNAKVDHARKNAEILYAASTVASTTDFFQVDTMIKAANDEQLLAEWNKFAETPTADASFNFLLYLMSSIEDDLK
jgi:uncharacterized protein HemX